MFLSVELKVPATVVGAAACRAVSWNPHMRAEGSLIVTTRCCFTPGEYVRPDGNATSTLPPPALRFVPTWHRDWLHVCSPGAAVAPTSGPEECAQINKGIVPITTAIFALISFLLRFIRKLRPFRRFRLSIPSDAGLFRSVSATCPFAASFSATYHRAYFWIT